MSWGKDISIGLWEAGVPTWKGYKTFDVKIFKWRVFTQMSHQIYPPKNYPKNNNGGFTRSRYMRHLRPSPYTVNGATSSVAELNCGFCAPHQKLGQALANWVAATQLELASKIVHVGGTDSKHVGYLCCEKSDWYLWILKTPPLVHCYNAAAATFQTKH